MSMQVIATAADADKFAEATLYTVTYTGAADMDSDVKWGYVEKVASDNNSIVICRNRDGSDAGRR